MCRVDVQLIFRRNKRSILNVNLKKYPKQTKHPVIDLKIELFVSIVIEFKLQTVFTKRSILDLSQVLNSSLTTINQTFFTNNKRTISQFFGMVNLTSQSGFYMFKFTRRNTENTLARFQMCLKLIIRTPE